MSSQRDFNNRLLAKRLNIPYKTLCKLATGNITIGRIIYRMDKYIDVPDKRDYLYYSDSTNTIHRKTKNYIWEHYINKTRESSVNKLYLLIGELENPSCQIPQFVGLNQGTRYNELSIE